MVAQPAASAWADGLVARDGERDAKSKETNDFINSDKKDGNFKRNISRNDQIQME